MLAAPPRSRPAPLFPRARGAFATHTAPHASISLAFDLAMSSYWASKGVRYLKYLQQATQVMRAGLKEPARSKLMKNGRISLRTFKVEKGGEKFST